MRWCGRAFTGESDEAVVLRAQAGEAGAAEELLNRYKNAVRARARKFFLEGGETEDLVQEGMIGLYTAIRTYSAEHGKSFKNYAYLCMTRRIYDTLRAADKLKGRQALDPDSLTAGTTPEESLLAGESQAEIEGTLMRALSDFEFRVVTLWLEGMSYASIAFETGKQLKSIDNALARSKKKLQKAFAGKQ